MKSSFFFFFLCSYLTCTDPGDVARVESKTVICTENKRDTIPEPAPGIHGALGKWISPSDLDNALNERFPGCMKGGWRWNRCLYDLSKEVVLCERWSYVRGGLLSFAGLMINYGISNSEQSQDAWKVGDIGMPVCATSLKRWSYVRGGLMWGVVLLSFTGLVVNYGISNIIVLEIP